MRDQPKDSYRIKNEMFTTDQTAKNLGVLTTAFYQGSPYADKRLTTVSEVISCSGASSFKILKWKNQKIKKDGPGRKRKVDLSYQSTWKTQSTLSSLSSASS